MKAYLLSLNPDANIADQWDFGFVSDFLHGKLWKTPDWQDFDIESVSSLPHGNKAVVILPARHHAGMEDKVNHELGKLNGGVLFLMGDEEAAFAVEKIDGPFHIWVQNPHPRRHDQYHKLGTGYPPQAKRWLPQNTPTKTTNVFFSGQITHKRRVQMINRLIEYEQMDNNCVVNPTRSFTAGYDHETYYRHMSSAKIVPAPAGAVIPDSFRLFEALESMAVPIADECDSAGTITEYWNWLFNEETPFPKIGNYDGLINITKEQLQQWPANMHRITAWWIAKKRDFVYKVMEQLK